MGHPAAFLVHDLFEVPGLDHLVFDLPKEEFLADGHQRHPAQRPPFGFYYHGQQGRGKQQRDRPRAERHRIAYTFAAGQITQARNIGRQGESRPYRGVDGRGRDG